MANISLPNMRPRISALRGLRPSGKDLVETVARNLHESAEALTTVQDALDLLVKHLNSVVTTVAESTSTDSDDAVAINDIAVTY